MKTPPEPDNECSSPKWEGFETWKGEPAPELPGWLDKILRGMFSIAGLTLVFCFCGTVAGLLLSVLFHGRNSNNFWRFWEMDTLSRWKLATDVAWAGFFAGGTLGVIVVVRWWRQSFGIEAPPKKRKRDRG